MKRIPQSEQNTIPLALNILYPFSNNVRRYIGGSGVYRILNTVTNNAYVGCSQDVKHRWRQHQTSLRVGKHKSHLMQSDYDNFGSDSFQFSVLDWCGWNGLRQIELQRIAETRFLCRTLYNYEEGDQTAEKSHVCITLAGFNTLIDIAECLEKEEGLAGYAEKIREIISDR